MILILFISTILGVSVGPSTAVLMRPRLGFWPAGGTAFGSTATKEDLMHLVVRDHVFLENCTQDTGNDRFPHAYWRSVREQYLSAWATSRARGTMPSVYYLPGEISTLDFGRHRLVNANMAMLAHWLLVPFLF